MYTKEYGRCPIGRDQQNMKRPEQHSIARPSCGCGLVPTGGLGYGPIRLARGLNELNKLNSVHMALSIIRVVIRSLQTAYTIMGKMNNAPPFRVQFYTEIQFWPWLIGISRFMATRYTIVCGHPKVNIR